ncbi:MAG: hypothetical protein HY234_07855 [Acidobacteria bacterium]|nr:hypothetical protein [Acidobacteriota bacterium]MBI3662944.1 hypothetical protein [Acidobacteriota bacterium]
MSTEATMQSETKGFCRNCGTPLTAETVREVRGTLYCEPCLAQMVAQPPRPQPLEGAGNATLAAILGVIPGLGAVYNGEFVKGFIHVLVFGALVSVLDSGRAGDFTPLFGMMMPAFVVYMCVDAYQTAKAKQMGKPRPGGLLGEIGRGQPVGAYVLIGLGALLLLDKFVPHIIGRVFDYWPVILIVIGVLLLRKRMGLGTSSEESGHEQRN